MRRGRRIKGKVDRLRGMLYDGKKEDVKKT